MRMLDDLRSTYNVDIAAAILMMSSDLPRHTEVRRGISKSAYPLTVLPSRHFNVLDGPPDLLALLAPVPSIR